MQVRNLLLRCKFVAVAFCVMLQHQVSAQLFDLHGNVIPGTEDVNLALPGNSLSEIDFSQVSLINTTIIASELSAEQVYATASYQLGDMRGVNFQYISGGFTIPYEMGGWDFRNQNLVGSQFEFANAANIDFFGANLTEAIVGYAQLQNATMTDAQLHNTSLFKSDLTNASFANSNLVGADLRDTKLNGTNFTNTNLQNASLRFATGALECDPFLGIEVCGVDVQASFADNFDATTTYNQWTQFPFGFDPGSSGMTFMESPVGDLSGDQTVDVDDVDELTARLRRGDDIDPLQIEPFGDGIVILEDGNDYTVFATPGAMVDKDALLEEYGVQAIGPIWDSSPEGIERWAAERRRLTAKNSEWLEPMFDLTGDGTVDDNDLTWWLANAATYNGFDDAYLAGDSNLDGSVDATDLNNLALNWRRNVTEWSGGDFTADGIVNAADLNALALNWRNSIAMASATNAPVPEPSVLALAVPIAGIALFWRRSAAEASFPVSSRLA